MTTVRAEKSPPQSWCGFNGDFYSFAACLRTAMVWRGGNVPAVTSRSSFGKDAHNKHKSLGLHARNLQKATHAFGLAQKSIRRFVVGELTLTK